MISLESVERQGFKPTTATKERQPLMGLSQLLFHIFSCNMWSNQIHSTVSVFACKEDLHLARQLLLTSQGHTKQQRVTDL